MTPEVKRLAVTLEPERARIPAGRLGPRSRQGARCAGAGARSEVTLWAVDEGVLSLTGYTTPDPIDLIYQERGLGMRLASNMTTVAPQVPEGMKGTREPGGGGGAAGADVLRSRFQTTAFFLGSVVTDAQGNATMTAKLPDNLTTFRVMAVAVTAGDRYGKGQSPLLVTRPLLARQALPRFVRPGDDFTAGAVINRRDGTAASGQGHRRGDRRRHCAATRRERPRSQLVAAPKCVSRSVAPRARQRDVPIRRHRRRRCRRGAGLAAGAP